MSVTTVHVCRKCKGAKRLLRDLAEHTDATLESVGCQKICSDHVVGVQRGDRLTWFEEVDAKKQRRALREFVAGPADVAVPKPLRSHVVAKRADQLRR